MNIQDYIREVVSQIAKGVNDVIREQEQYNVIINPKMTIGDSVDIRFIPKNIDSYKNYGRPAQLLRLDMGIQTKEGNIIEVKGGVCLPWLNVGGGGTEDTTQSNMNRVCIAIPICLPNSPIDKEDK